MHACIPVGVMIIPALPTGYISLVLQLVLRLYDFLCSEDRLHFVCLSVCLQIRSEPSLIFRTFPYFV